MQENHHRSMAAPDNPPMARWYQLHALALLAYVRQYVPAREDAEDIVVEVFIAALEHKGFSPLALNEQEQMAWLRRVAYYKCIDRVRMLARRSVAPVENLAETLLEDERLSPDQIVLRREEHALLHERLGQLPEHYQTALRLRFADGLRCSEIGRRLNKSEGAIRILLSRALNSLRDIYTR